MGITVRDESGDAMTFSLVDDAGGRFAIDPVSGEVTLQTTLDYSSYTEHRILVRGVSASGSTGEAYFDIWVQPGPPRTVYLTTPQLCLGSRQ